MISVKCLKDGMCFFDEKGTLLRLVIRIHCFNSDLAYMEVTLMKQNKQMIRRIAVLSLMIAIIVIFSHFIAIETQVMKFSFTFIPEAITGALFGPLWSAVANVIADFIGMWLAPKASFFFGFTLNALLTGLIYGYFCSKNPMRWQNIAKAVIVNAVIVHLVLTPLWLQMMYDMPYVVQIGPRLIKELITIPLQIILLSLIMKRLPWKKMLKIVDNHKKK